MELRQREALPGLPVAATERLKEIDRAILNSADRPLFIVPKPDIKGVVQSCLDHKNPERRLKDSRRQSSVSANT
jgi:hypothetical protein